jgi:hypothetical protein
MHTSGFAHLILILLVPTFLIAALIAFVVLDGSSLGQSAIKNDSVGQIVPLEPTNKSGDKKIYTDSGLGFKVETPSSWQSLKGPCEEIIVSFTSSDQSIYDYVSTQGWGSKEDLDAVIGQIKNTPSLNSQILFNLDNFQKEDYLILGPQGEGEINSLFVRSGSGYFDITVWATDQRSALSSSCVGASEYKDVLRSFSAI